MTIQPINTNASAFARIQSPAINWSKASVSPENLVGSPANASSQVSISQTTIDLAMQGGGYDFTHMTPNRMRGLAREWHGEGKIDPVQLFELENAGVPLGRMGAHGEFIPLSEAEKNRYADTPVDYLQIAGNAVRFLEETGNAADPRSTIKEWRGILALLQGMQGQGGKNG